MIKQDYLIRMIQEIISLIVNALLQKKKYRWSEWTEYDDLTRQILGFPSEDLLGMNIEELIDRYKGDPNEMGKTELAAMTMLKISDDMGTDDLLRKSNFVRTDLHCSSMYKKKAIASLYSGYS